MINAIGLQNVGVDAFIEEKLPFLRKIKIPVIANIFGETLEEYGEVARRLDKGGGAGGVAGIEINISCPNVKKGGIEFGTDPREAHKVVSAVRKADAGTDAISLINTVTAMAVDVEKKKPVLATVTGGLSGPAIRPIAVRLVWQAARAAKVPVIGIGGIMTGTDAMEFFLAGASAVQVGTANFVDPASAIKVLEGIEDYMKRHRIKNIKKLVGALEVG
jgi:dihydroorotate dehydrogenase (NAD+) catalytic subunit